MWKRGLLVAARSLVQRALLLFLLGPCFLAVLGSASSHVYFKEQFTDGAWKTRWVQSKYKTDYGKFKLTSGTFYGDVQKDKGIQTRGDAKYFAISSRFKPFSNVEKTLVIQYTVKHERKIDCGGGYVKLYPSKLDQVYMNGESQYYIMFGPDICGYGRKIVHVILHYKGVNHSIKKEIRCKDDSYTHLYTLILRPNQTYEIKIDNVKTESGHLEDDFNFLVPKKIKDPTAVKPEDWDDRKKINDPMDMKPKDWDKPKYIIDTSAKKPKDWDNEMDGEWEPPNIKNPEYKGKWKPRQIDNPNYKGVWVHPKIDNPHYSPDLNIYKYDDIGVIGLDLWQVRSGTIFDNFLITDDDRFAEEFGNNTWGKTKDPEKKMKEYTDEREKQQQRREDRKWDEQKKLWQSRDNKKRKTEQYKEGRRDNTSDKEGKEKVKTEKQDKTEL
ncbi:calreticulin-3 isoform X2 [Rhinatrema bivittatum]|uniref:calreticulin-3 isoform X2 n=1 Tax=Rhinatrema bivittatum TaxID=194408 RepID=UPI00112C8CB4|nr:calreticulin-3 isoform X2 [Rhinatrema bivittatum]